MERPDRLGSRVAGLLIGAAAGTIVGLIVAVNLVITFGPAQGYESSIGEVFDHSIVLGVATVAVVAAGPFLGIVMALRLRRQSDRRPQP